MEPQKIESDVRIQMEGAAQSDDGAVQPTSKKLVRIKGGKLKKIRRSKSSPLAIGSGSPDSKYVTDARDFIIHIPSFGAEYPEDEIAKALKYYAQTYPTDYGLFMVRVRNLKAESNGDSSCDQNLSIIKLLELMYEFRYEKAHEHLADKEEISIAHQELQGEHQDLQARNEVQQQQTKYANYRAIGVAVGGMIVTVVTGLTTYFAHPGSSCQVCPVNATARALMVALNVSGI